MTSISMTISMCTIYMCVVCVCCLCMHECTYVSVQVCICAGTCVCKYVHGVCGGVLHICCVCVTYDTCLL